MGRDSPLPPAKGQPSISPTNDNPIYQAYVPQIVLTALEARLPYSTQPGRLPEVARLRTSTSSNTDTSSGCTFAMAGTSPQKSIIGAHLTIVKVF